MEKKNLLNQLIEEIETRIPHEKIAEAKNLLKIPSKEDAIKMTNEKLVFALKAIGLATREEVEALEQRVSDLEEKIMNCKELHQEMTPPETE